MTYKLFTEFITFLLLIPFIVCLNGDVEDLKKVESDRTKKQFSLFTIVSFPNDQCSAKSSSTTGIAYGTCLSSTECNSDGGTIDGNCASGFGVCCTFKKTSCGSTITKNCTYIQNPGYSSAYTTSGSCSYSVTPLSSSICQMRLDFKKFATTIATSGTCTDSFDITGPSNTNSLSVLCGTLTGQHIYFENARSTTSSTLAFTIATTTTGATFNIKVSQISCSSSYKAPSDCAQWVTGQSGKIQSYNWQGGDQITSNQFTFCIRREAGYCAIEYYKAPTTSTISTFLTHTSPTAAEKGNLAATLEGYVHISGMATKHHWSTATSMNPNTYAGSAVAGSVFGYTDGAAISSVVTSYGPRFILSHVVESASASTTATGFNLQWNQLPCSSVPHM